ncbi:MAG TPA: hypothetical protein VMT69_00685 [Kineosporiaceae bacterium]|nr:hypothetical protein [Kineosporiaceae bacterium]
MLTPVRSQGEADPGRRPAWRRPRIRAACLRAALRDALPAVAVFVGIRVLGLLALVLLARARGIDGLARLDTYDAPRLLEIAAHGYDPLGPFDAAGRELESNIAFFPLYPLAVRLVAAVPGVAVTAAGFAVTAIAGVAAAVGLDRFGRRVVVTARAPSGVAPGTANGTTESTADGSADGMAGRMAGGSALARRGGLVLVALWACWPHSAVLAMPYTEPLFVALAVWSLVALLDRRWVTSGVLALLAGATRPVGTALAAAVALAAVAAVASDLRDRRRPSLRPVVAAVLAPIGFLGYWGWLWMHTGRPDAWFWVQAHEWHSRFDGGRFTAESVAAAATRPQALVLVVCAAVVVASVVLLVALVVEGAPLPVVVYTALATYTVVGADGYANSKARFLLCAFPLVVPLARAVDRAPVRTLVVLLTGLAVLSAWYNAFVLVVWTYSP